MKQQTLIFDLDGVLVGGWHYNPEKRGTPWFADMQKDLGVDPERYIKTYYRGQFEEDVLTGKLSLLKALDVVLAEVGYQGSSESFVAYWMQKNSNLNMPLVKAVTKIKKAGDVRLVVATDNEHIRIDHLLKKTALGDLFDDVFFAASLGVTKRSITFFDICNQRLGCHGQPAPIFFDDNPGIVVNAKKAGWDAVVYNDFDDFAKHPRVAPMLKVAVNKL